MNDLIMHQGAMLPLKDSKEILLKLEEFNKRLQEKPDPKNLQKTPDGKAEYLPIDFVENQLREDFAGLVEFTVISERRELNEYIVHARITVVHPVAMMKLNYDGIGVTQIMQDKDATLAQFNETKKKNALEMNAPKAYSEAIKNAAKKIGKKYGGSVNRKHEDNYVGIYTAEDLREPAMEELRKATSKEEIKAIVSKYPELKSDKEFMKQATAKHNQL